MNRSAGEPLLSTLITSIYPFPTTKRIQIFDARSELKNQRFCVEDDDGQHCPLTVKRRAFAVEKCGLVRRYCPAAIFVATIVPNSFKSTTNSVGLSHCKLPTQISGLRFRTLLNARSPLHLDATEHNGQPTQPQPR